MSLLVENIAAFCREHPLEEKILVVPAHLVGHEIVASIAAAGQPVFNLRIETSRSLATGLLAEELAREDIRVLSRAEEMAVVEDACQGAGAYFGAIRRNPGFHEAVTETLREFSEAGLDPAAIRLPSNEKKERDLSSIGRRYREILEQKRFLDRAGLLRRALQRAAPLGAFVLVPRHPRLAGDERPLVEALAGDRWREIPTDDPGDWRRRAGDFAIARASSAEEEIRRVFRRLSTEGAALDQAELVYVQADSLRMIFELSRELGLPATFAEGIPLFYTRPGRAALGLLRWLERDFEAETLAALAEEGVVKMNGFAGAIPGREIAGVLRQAGIGWGRERYARCLPPSHPLRGWADSLLAEAAEFDVRGTVSPSDLGTWLARLVERTEVVRDVGGEGWDAAGKETLSLVLPEIAGIERPQRPASEAIALVREILEATATAGSGPRPGCLHVAGIAWGGYSGRARTFLVGLDADHFPGRLREDPLLSDREREAINSGRLPGLRLRTDRGRETREELDAMLSRLRGCVEVSYPARDPVENSEIFPSPVLLDLLRERSGRREDDYRALKLEVTARSRDEGPPEPLCEKEWWIEGVRRRLLEPSVVREQAGSLLPLVGTGLAAEMRRGEEAFTEYDGRLSSFPGRFDPRLGSAISASSIELFARCPYRWFLEKGLKLEPLERFARDEDIWLDEMAFGSVAHEVLRDFMVELSGRPPGPADAPRLKALARARLDARKAELPTPPEATENWTRRRMERLCEEFLRLESTVSAGGRAAGFEVELGSATAAGSEFGSAEPARVALGGGASFPLIGRIDRVDIAADGSIVVLDYKTGRRPKRAEKEGFAAGRRIQPALYALALEELEAGEKAPRTASSARYYYLAPGAAGFVENLGSSGRDELRGILSALFDGMAAGSFPHSRDENHCARCEFAAVCGGARAWARAGAKMDRDPAPDDPLEPFRRLKGWARGGRAS